MWVNKYHIVFTIILGGIAFLVGLGQGSKIREKNVVEILQEVVQSDPNNKTENLLKEEKEEQRIIEMTERELDMIEMEKEIERLKKENE